MRILLYLLWDARPVEGRKLNAVAFQSIIASIESWSPWVKDRTLFAVLALEAGLLLVAANTGFLGGPAVLSNMAVDSWVPRHFRDLSGRLVKQNGVVVMGVAALGILIWTQGKVSVLVVLYSINVFLTFSLSLLGLCVHWTRQRRTRQRWRRRLLLSAIGLAVTAGILVVTAVEKFGEGGWVTVVITSVVIGLCLLVKQHYDETRAQLQKMDRLFEATLQPDEKAHPPMLDPSNRTAVIMVGKHRGIGIHALLWILRLFPDQFKNFIFIAVGEVDVQSYDGQGALRTLRYTLENSLRYFTSYCHNHGLAAEYYMAFGTDPVQQFTTLAEQVSAKYPNSVYFAAKLIFEQVNFLTSWLHNHAPLDLQERMHMKGRQMVLLPMRVG